MALSGTYVLMHPVEHAFLPAEYIDMCRSITKTQPQRLRESVEKLPDTIANSVTVVEIRKLMIANEIPHPERLKQ